MRTLILDISSPEVNRGSYCYMPYLLHAALNVKHNSSADIVEDFTIPMLKDLDLHGVDEVRAAIWSYPQIETALMLYRLWEHPEIPLTFFGYWPLIEHIGLPENQPGLHKLAEGLAYYPKYITKGAYRHILLSDCDAHLKNGGDVQVYPMFTSYGCPRQCNFCSASENTGGHRLALQMDLVKSNLRDFHNHGISAIHFTDEDFFYDEERAIEILAFLYDLNPNFQVIALAHANTLYKFLTHPYLENPHTRQKMSVLKLAEVGLETADVKSAGAMGKQGIASSKVLKTLGENDLCKILWLTMTFYPGDTVSAMNTTGHFLELYGLDPNDMCERIRTNGTVGGLGQFFQYYHGCGDYELLKREGMILTDRPMRLLPSFLPDSFLKSPIEAVSTNFEPRIDKALMWAEYNGVPKEIMREVIKEIGNEPVSLSPAMLICQKSDYLYRAQTACAIAILARLCMIREAN